MAANAIMAPVNVAKRYTEGVLTDPYNDEQNARNAADTALTLAGAGAPAAEEGALGIFAGMGAKTANRPKLALAMDMEKEGAHPEAVWQKTGWFRGVDDKWRFEIPDYASQIYRAKPGQPDTTLVEHQLTHPELFEAYPDLAHRMLNDIPRDPISGIPSGHGGFRPSTGQLYLDKDVTTTPFSERRGVLLHELQHAVQQKEGFAPGSSTKHPEVQAEAGRIFQERQRDARSTQNDLLALQTKYIDDQIKAGRNMTRVDLSREFWDKNPDLKDKWTNAVDAMIPNRNLDLFTAYKRVAGEVEARNVADRAYHPPSTLTAPWTTEDTPRGMQILPGRGGFPTGRASGGRVMSHYIDKNPSEAQKRYGNYKKAHVNIHGLDISIENAKGQLRKGVGKDGKPWSVSMPAHYGYIKRTEGADGDHVDCYVGPHTSSRKVFVVDQKDADTGKFDEHKCLLGFGSQKQAADLYLKGFSDGRGSARLGHMTEMDIDQFRHWLKRDDTTEPIKGTHHAPKIDTSHDVRWISEMSKDGTIFYRDRSLPERIINNKKWLKIDEPLLRHEVAEYAAIKRMTAEFERKNGRKPDDKEREEIYKTSHYEFGEVAEHEYLKEHGFDVGSWEAWCRGKLSHLENKKQVKPPPNPHVRPMPHDRRELESAV